MSDRIDLGRVGRVAAEVAEIHGRAVEESTRLVAAELTPAEQELMALGLAAHPVDELRSAEVLRDPRMLLELTYRELLEDGRRHFKYGHGERWLADQLLPSWASRPERTLADVIKVEPPERVAHLARELRHAGIHDLDPLSPPDLMTGD